MQFRKLLLLPFLLLLLLQGLTQELSIRYQNGLTAQIKSIIPLEDRQTLLVFAQNGEWLVWDLPGNRILLRQKSSSSLLSDVVYAPRLQLLFLAGDEGMEVFDLRQLLTEQKIIPAFSWKTEGVNSVSVDEESGSIFLLTQEGRLIRFRDREALQENKINAEQRIPFSVPFSVRQHGNLLLVLGVNRQLLLSLPELQLLATGTESNTGPYGVAFDPRDSACYVAYESSVKKLSYRGLQWKSTLYTSPIPKGKGLVLGLTVDTTNGTLYVGTNRDQVFRVQRGTAALQPLLRQEHGSFTSLLLIGNKLLLGDFFGNVTVFDPASRTALFRLSEDVTPSVNGVYLYKNQFMVSTHFGNRGSSVKIWQLATARLEASFSLHNQQIYRITISKNGDSIRSYHTDDAVYLFTRKEGRYVQDTLQRASNSFFFGSVFFRTDLDQVSQRSKQEQSLRNLLHRKGISHTTVDGPQPVDLNFIINFTDTCERNKMPASFRKPAALLVAAGLGAETAGWDLMEKDLSYLYACNADSFPAFRQRMERHQLPAEKLLHYYELVKGKKTAPNSFFITDAVSNSTLATFFLEASPSFIDFEQLPERLLIGYQDHVAIWERRLNRIRSLPVTHRLFDSYIDYNEYFFVAADPQTNTITLVPNHEPAQTSGSTQWMAFGTDDYVVFTPDAYFTTKGRSGQVQFLRDQVPVSFNTFDLNYNRPDIVMQRIGIADSVLIQLYRSAWEKRIRKTGLVIKENRSASVPQLTIVNKDSLSYIQTDGTIELHLKAVTAGSTLQRMNIWVNEVPLFGSRGLVPGQGSEQSLDTVVRIPLSTGTNIIEASVLSAEGIESSKAPLRFLYKPKQPVTETVYFIGIGLNRFADNRHNLRWCVKDIRDLALQLKMKYGSRMIIDTLFDEAVTLENIRRLKQKLQQMSIHDKVIISYSGHGLLNSSGSYYLSSYAVNFSNPEEQGIPYEEIEQLLDGIPARKKLLFIDACHSGEVDQDDLVGIQQKKKEATNSQLLLHRGSGEEILIEKKGVGLQNSFDLMQALFVNLGKGTGTLIIAAAGGVQLAQERGDLQNGVFTFSVLEALRTKKTMRASDLIQFVNKRVQELTNGLQQPTTRQELKLADWSVW